MSLSIVADENIPLPPQWLQPSMTVRTVAGRSIDRATLADCDALLVRSVTRVDSPLLDGTPVRFVGTATIGTDHVDSNWLQRAGIAFIAAPGCNARAVVEYVLSACCRLTRDRGLDLAGARVGIVGMGNVGGALYRQLDALGIRCLGYDPLIPPDRYPVLCDDLDAVLQCDVVCLHTPLTRDGAHPTWHLLGRERLAALRRDAVLVNAGRGAAVDNAALLQVLEERPQLAAVLDVWEGEPAIDSALARQVALATPHIAGYSALGKARGAQRVFAALCRHFGFDDSAVKVAGEIGAAVTVTASEPFAALAEAVLAVYDIGRDHRALTATLDGPAGERAVAFDRLRRDYPLRLEFSQVEVAAPAAVQPLLRAAGFRLG